MFAATCSAALAETACPNYQKAHSHAAARCEGRSKAPGPEAADSGHGSAARARVRGLPQQGSGTGVLPQVQTPAGFLEVEAIAPKPQDISPNLCALLIGPLEINDMSLVASFLLTCCPPGLQVIMVFSFRTCFTNLNMVP